MKKLLALVLALVMSMSLVTISNAADFSDASDISYEEAVDVLAGVGVLVGSNGKFDPKAELTRNQAAKIIAYLDLGEKTADALTGTGAVFTDVPASNWAAGYIEYCAQAGYVSGIGNKQFDPNGKLTGLQFAKMLLAVLGYDAAVETLEGSDWAINTAKLGSKNDLFKGLEKASTAVLTREEAAQMALNALQATMVEYDTKGTNITIGGSANIVVGASKAEKVTKADNKYSKISNDKDGSLYYVELGEELYEGKLVKNDSGKKDDLGRKAIQWTYKNDEIGTYGEAADVVYTLTDTYTVNSNATLLAELKGEDFTDNDDLTLANNVKVYVNGADATSANLAAAFSNAAKGGVKVELTYNDDDVNMIDRVVVLAYSIAQIDDVSEKVTKAQKEDGATCKIKIDGESYVLDNDFVGFDASTYVEDAYVCYIQVGTEVYASQLATKVEGEVSSTKGSNKATINGTTYKYVGGVTIDVEDDGEFYLNVAGQIGAVDTTSKSNDYIYIYSIDKDPGKANSDGVKEDIFTAYYVKADGTKASAVVATEKDGGKYYFKDYKVSGSKVEVTESVKGVFAFSTNSDKELLLEKAKDTIKQTDELIGKNNAYGTDSDTSFVFVYKDGSKMKTSVATGYKNVKVAAGSDVYTVTNSNDDIILVFVDGGANDNKYTSSKMYAVVLDKNATVTKNKDGDKVYTYSVSIDGEDTTLTFENSQNFVKGQIFSYTQGTDYAEVDSTLTLKQAGSSTKNYVTLDGEQYNLGEDESVYTVTVEYKKSANVNPDANGFNPASHTGDIDTVTVSEGGKADKDDYVMYGLDGGDLDVLFVFDYIG